MSTTVKFVRDSKHLNGRIRNTGHTYRHNLKRLRKASRRK